MEESSIESACAMWDKGMSLNYNVCMCVRNCMQFERIWANFIYKVQYIITIMICQAYYSIYTGESEDRFGAWSTEGCKEVMREGNRRVCECTQLAHFGILFVS